MTNHFKPFVFCVAITAFVGCRTNKDILNDYEKDLLSGNYEHATVEVSQKAESAGSDQLLWRLQAASAWRLTGDREKAIGHFDGAEDIFLANDAMSVFSHGVSGSCAMLTNDRAFPFSGGGQDRVFTCLYKAVDYAVDGHIDAMRTELNRAAQHQENWIFERRRDIEAAKEKLQNDAAQYATENKSENKDCSASVAGAFADGPFATAIRENTGFDPVVDGNLDTLSQKDYLNVYVQHVCGAFRWITDGDGCDYMKGLTDICPGNGMLVRDLEESKSHVKPVDQVWVYVEDGLCPCREEWRVDLPLALIPFAGRYVLYAGMALPYLRYRSPAASSYAVIADGRTVPLEVLQDMDRLMKVEHDVYFRGALTREITRVIVKAGAQVALGVVYDSLKNDYQKLAVLSSQIAVAAYAASVTQADLRSWTALPKVVYAVRVTRPADGRITVTADGVNAVEVCLPVGNSMVFVTKPGPAAVPSTRVVTFK